MRDHVIRSVNKAYALLVEAPPVVPDHLLPKTGMARIVWAHPPQQHPWFYRDERIFDSPQRDFFGFYVLARATRATLIGARYLQAGDVLLAGDYCAAAVVAYYTAALNLTLAYLALEGRVFIDFPHGPPVPDAKGGEPMWSEIRDKGGQRRSMLAKLSKRGLWNFEAKPCGHDSRWQELLPLLDELRREKPPSSLPDPFWGLLGYCTTYGNDYLGGKDGCDDAERDLLEEGIKAIPEIRHEAVYRGYGYDDLAVDAAFAGESSASGFNRKPHAFRLFGAAMVEQVADDVWRCVDGVDPTHWVALFSATSQAALLPEYELPSITRDSTESTWQRVDQLMMAFKVAR